MPVEVIVDVLKAIADPTRFQILHAVSSRERRVSQLAKQTGTHVAAISQHLAKLRAAGLVIVRREGRRIYYRAAHPHIGVLLAEAGLLTGYINGLITPPAPTTATDAITGAARPAAAAGVRRPGWALADATLRLARP